MAIFFCFPLVNHIMSAILSRAAELDVLARGQAALQFDGSPTATPTPKLKGGSDDSNMGMIMIAVAMGCLAALVLLYIVRQHTTLPESVAKMLQKKPTSLSKKEASSDPASTAAVSLKKTPGKILSELKKKAHSSPSKPAKRHSEPPVKPTSLKKEVSEKKEDPVSLTAKINGPKPRGASTHVKAQEVGTSTVLSGQSMEELPKPRMPSVPKANNIEGSNKVMEANRSLIEAAQTGELRQKLSRATWGLAPVVDRKPELPTHQSKIVLNPEREKFLWEQYKKNTEKIVNSGAVPVLFDLPADFNAKIDEPDRLVGQNLALEANPMKFQ